MQDVSFLPLTIPAHTFFLQAVLEGEVSDDLFKCRCFLPKFPHLPGGRGAGGVSSKPTLPGLEKFHRRAIIHGGDYSLLVASLREALLAPEPLQEDTVFAFRRRMPMRSSPNVL